jgi:hypothetical protein
MVPNLANKGMRRLFHEVKDDKVDGHFCGLNMSDILRNPEVAGARSPGQSPPIWERFQDIVWILLRLEFTFLWQVFQDVESPWSPYNCQHEPWQLHCLRLSVKGDFSGQYPQQIAFTVQVDLDLV